MIWLAIALCLLVSFCFSGIEAGILSVNRVRLKHRANCGEAAAVKLDRLLDRPERVLVTVLIVTNLMNIFSIVLGTEQLVRYLGNAGYAAAFVLSLPLYLLGLELLPKSIFRRFPFRALAALSEPLRIADLLLSPVLKVGDWVAWNVFRKKSEPKTKLFVAREDFKYLTAESERVGTLTKVEREMIHNVIDLRAITAREVMVPLDHVRTAPSTATLDEVLAAGREHDLDRLPITSEGKIIGLLNVLEALLDRTPQSNVASFTRRIINVGADEPAYPVFRKLRAARAGLAIVTGPEGKTEGIVSSEDLIKRLVRPAAAVEGPLSAA